MNHTHSAKAVQAQETVHQYDTQDADKWITELQSLQVQMDNIGSDKR